MNICLVSVVCSGADVSATADHFSRGVLPTVLCLSVTAKPLSSGGPAHIGAFWIWKIDINIEGSVRKITYKYS